MLDLQADPDVKCLSEVQADGLLQKPTAMRSPFAVEAAKYSGGQSGEGQAGGVQGPAAGEAGPASSTKAQRFINPLARRRAHAGHHSGSGSGGLMSPRTTLPSGLQAATSINAPILHA